MVSGPEQFQIIPDRQWTGPELGRQNHLALRTNMYSEQFVFLSFQSCHAHIRMASGSSLVTALHPPSFRHHQLGPTWVPLVIFSSPAPLLLFPLVPFLVPENTSHLLKKEWFGQDAKGESCAPGKFY